MYHWAPVLDKFDEILEVIVKEYKIDEVQTKPFAEDDKNMILEIARVQRLLMENVTSRKMFASYDVRIQALTTLESSFLTKFTLCIRSHRDILHFFSHQIWTFYKPL
jgi:hypothetical protein